MPKTTGSRGGTISNVAQTEQQDVLLLGKRITIRDGAIEFSAGTGGLPDVRLFRDPATGALYVGLLVIGGDLTVSGDLSVGDDLTVSGDAGVTGTLTAFGFFGAGGNVQLGSGASLIAFFGGTPIAKPTVSGARNSGEGALADLLTELANLGLITNSTTAS